VHPLRLCSDRTDGSHWSRPKVKRQFRAIAGKAKGVAIPIVQIAGRDKVTGARPRNRAKLVSPPTSRRLVPSEFTTYRPGSRVPVSGVVRNYGNWRRNLHAIRREPEVGIPTIDSNDLVRITAVRIHETHCATFPGENPGAVGADVTCGPPPPCHMSRASGSYHHNLRIDKIAAGVAIVGTRTSDLRAVALMANE